ncbi:TonB-dependent receptor [Escherichia coli]|uniref:TonB-dependent receptor n=1 Tax=Escherichia coli TaxID=562 RepID=A0A376MK03_ECOLX|nr:TonB-dependent receptor [Escherichia coli]
MYVVGWRKPGWLHHDQRPAKLYFLAVSTPPQKRVEVLKGPASTLYGILDPGGLINVVTKRPEKTFHGSVSATSSSFGGGTGQLDITGPIEALSWHTA